MNLRWRQRAGVIGARRSVIRRAPASARNSHPTAFRKWRMGIVNTNTRTLTTSPPHSQFLPPLVSRNSCRHIDRTDQFAAPPRAKALLPDGHRSRHLRAASPSCPTRLKPNPDAKTVPWTHHPKTESNCWAGNFPDFGPVRDQNQRSAFNRPRQRPWQAGIPLPPNSIPPTKSSATAESFCWGWKCRSISPGHEKPTRPPPRRATSSPVQYCYRRPRAAGNSPGYLGTH